MKIRYGTFETNSSSAHTFVLRSNENYVTDEEIELYKRDVMEDHAYGNYLPIARSFNGDMDFGRGFEILAEWHEKLAYLFAAFQGDENSKIVVDVVKKRLGVDGVLIYDNDTSDDEDDINLPLYENQWEEMDCFGSIDHESYDCYSHAIEAIRKHEHYKDMSIEEIVYEMIFCNKFVIVTDSDESWTFEKLAAQSFFKDAGFTHILHEEFVYRDDGNYHYISTFKTFEDYMKKREDIE